MKNYLFHVEAAQKYFFEAAQKYFFHIFCKGRYTWSLGENISFTTFEEEFIYCKILPSPSPPDI